MSVPLLKRKTVLAAKIEATPYVAESLVGADSNFNVFDVAPVINIEQREREAADGFSNRASTSGLRAGAIAFKVDLTGNGAGGVPQWASTFLPACALVAVGNTFGPVSRPPAEGGSTDFGVRTLTIGVYEDGRRKLFRGCMGTAKFMFPTGKDAFVEFNFQGSYVDTDDQPLLVPTYPTVLPFRFAAASLLINSVAPCVQEVAVDIGNQVVMRECQEASDASGYRGALASNRKVIGQMDPEAQLVADYDFFGDWEDSVERAMSLSMTSGPDVFTITVPKMQLTNIGEGERNNIRTDPITWQANRNAAADDEITILFDGP